MSRRWLAVCLLVFLSGVRESGAAEPDTLPKGLPEDFGQFVLEGLKQWNAPGTAIAVVKGGETILAAGYGVREAGKPEPVDGETLFAIGSTTKAFTAAALGMLVDEELVAWDTRVTEIAPDVRFSDPWITGEMRVVDTMSNRSGLGAASEELWYGSGFPREEILSRMSEVPFDDGFRDRFQYRNVMFLLGGELIPRLTGQSWEEVMSARFFEPLGMKRTFPTDEGIEEQENVARPHLIDHEGNPVPVPYRDMKNIAPAGSIISCAADLAEWMKLLLAEGRAGDVQILQPETLAYLHRSHTPMEDIGPAGQRLPFRSELRSYALGWITESYRGQTLVWHNGGIDGMSAWVGLAPGLDLGVAIITNLENSDLRAAIFYRLVDHFSGQSMTDLRPLLLERHRAVLAGRDEDETKWQQLAVAPADPGRPLAAYAGTYAHPALGEVELSEEDGRLVFVRTAQQTLDLVPTGPDEFLARYRNDNEDLRSGKLALTFEEENGKIVSFAENEALVRTRTAE